MEQIIFYWKAFNIDLKATGDIDESEINLDIQNISRYFSIYQLEV